MVSRLENIIFTWLQEFSPRCEEFFVIDLLLWDNKANHGKVVLWPAEVVIGEVLFLKEILLRTSTKCIGWSDNGSCFDVCVLQFEDMLESCGKVTYLKINRLSTFATCFIRTKKFCTFNIDNTGSLTTCNSRTTSLAPSSNETRDYSFWQVETTQRFSRRVRISHLIFYLGYRQAEITNHHKPWLHWSK